MNHIVGARWLLPSEGEVGVWVRIPGKPQSATSRTLCSSTETSPKQYSGKEEDVRIQLDLHGLEPRAVRNLCRPTCKQ